jgi:hypothetical protein
MSRIPALGVGRVDPAFYVYRTAVVNAISPHRFPG